MTVRARNRAGHTSTYMVIGYCGSIVAVLGMGWIAHRWGMDLAVAIFGATTIGVSAVLILAQLLLGRRRAG